LSRRTQKSAENCRPFARNLQPGIGILRRAAVVTGEVVRECEGAVLEIGRISMDSIVVDIGAVPTGYIGPDAMADIIGDDRSIDDLALSMNTIGYEVWTSLSLRLKRIYRDIAGPSILPGEGALS
jgi:alanine racemase